MHTRNPYVVDTKEHAVVDIIRLGLKPDAASVQRYAKRLLKTKDSWSVELRSAVSKLVVENAATSVVRRASVPEDLRANAGTVIRIDESTEAEPPVLPPNLTTTLSQLVVERQKLSLLAEAGLDPTRTLLLTGPPGVGKSMTAKYLATALGVPLVTVELSAVMSSFLGRSGQNLEQAIDYARSEPCVLLVDEFDAIAKRRDDPTDVGELKRVVNVLLLELEHWPSTGLFIAATNHPELLDRAIWRRFERSLTIPLPEKSARLEILGRVLGRYDVNLSTGQVASLAAASKGLSGSDIDTVVRSAVRRALVTQDNPDHFRELAAELLGRMLEGRPAEELDRRSVCLLASKHLRWSNREIGRALGVSHVTIGKLLKSSGTATEKPRNKEGNGSNE